MEQIKFIDVAQYYIGIKIYMPSKNVFKLIGIIKNDTGIMVLLDNIPLKWVEFQSTWKPVLRPLCSFTEFEALEFGKMVLDKDITHVSILIKNEKEDSVKMLFSNKTERIEITDYYISAIRLFENSMDEVSINNYGKIIVWLTGKGFDIFGMIKSMEALKQEN